MAAFTDRQRALLNYCRIDDPTQEDLELLEGLYTDAVSYMSHAGVAEPDPGSARMAEYSMCVNALVLDAWDNRGIQTGDKTLTDNPAFRRRIVQLKLTEAVRSDSDTEG